MLVLRDYQEELVASTLQALKEGHRNILVVASTGAGKTICFVEICNRISESLREDECILVLSHLSLLTTQTQDKFNKFSEIETGVLQAEKMPSYTANVVISTMQSSRSEEKMTDYIALSEKAPRYIIVDEAHRRFSASYKTIFEMFPEAQIIDFTATPYKNSKIASGFYDKVAFQISMKELIKQKYLVPPILRQIEFNSDDSAVKASLVVKLVQTKEEGKSGIIFAKSKAEAKLFSDVLNKHGIEARTITDEVNEKQREKIFKQYEAGEIKVLVSVDVLTAGFDAPICSFIIMFETGSVVSYIQRTGRALRPYEGKSHANIYYLGKTPKIKSGEIEKLHNNIMNPKKKEDCKTVEELVDWLEDHDQKDSPEYHFSKEVNKAIRLAKKLNLSTLSRLLNTRDFPEKFTGKLIKTLASTYKRPHDKPITPKQRALVDKIIPQVDAAKLTKNEASVLIESVLGKKKHPIDSPYVFKEGPHKGKHVTEVPWAYKKHAKSKSALEVIRAWNNRNK